MDYVLSKMRRLRDRINTKKEDNNRQKTEKLEEKFNSLPFDSKEKEKLHQRLARLSEVALEHIPEDEEKLRQKLDTEINFDRTVLRPSSARGKIEYLKVRKIAHGGHEYTVSDSVSSAHAVGFYRWGYDRSEPFDETRQERVISVTKDGQTESLTLWSLKGFQTNRDTAQETHYSGAKYGFTEKKERELPTDINLKDINAIRYALEETGDMSAVYFLDKYVIITPQEREAYQKYKENKDIAKPSPSKNLTSATKFNANPPITVKPKERD